MMRKRELVWIFLAIVLAIVWWRMRASHTPSVTQRLALFPLAKEIVPGQFSLKNPAYG